ncbi:hypothetical protein SAMN04489761_0203 [Tenacibaculum sp. MAR_2009_124]|nr:hypothetical protein SAMN04489761_0203 [Tenacibaculum sp. MAR_2009_124]
MHTNYLKEDVDLRGIAKKTKGRIENEISK